MFRHYEGRKDTLLYYFFLSAFKVPLGFYRNIEIEDHFPLNLVMNKFALFIQDFTAPFLKFVRSEYSLKYDHIDNELMTSRICLASSSSNYFAGRTSSGYNFMIEIDENGISSIKVNNAGISITATSCKEL